MIQIRRARRDKVRMDFTLQYAVKEIKKRSMEFFPILLISLSVLVLIFNMIIYYESQRITDISYYRLDFEIKLYEMPDESIEYIKALPYVKNVRKANDFTLNIGFKPPYNQAADSIYDTEAILNDLIILEAMFFRQ